MFFRISGESQHECTRILAFRVLMIISSESRAMGRNADIYPDPLEFKPERFLPGGVNFNSVRPEEFVFGYGRR